MDNNNFQQQPNQQQPYQQQPYQQQPNQQQPYQQQPYQQQPYQQAPKKQSNVNVLSLVAVICSGVSLIMAILGSAFACSCSASKSYDMERAIKAAFTGDNVHVTSAVIVVCIIAALIAVVGAVLGFVALKSNSSDILAKIAVVVGVVAFAWAVLPMLTICGYNCSLNSAYEDALK